MPCVIFPTSAASGRRIANSGGGVPADFGPMLGGGTPSPFKPAKPSSLREAEAADLLFHVLQERRGAGAIHDAVVKGQ